jgi:LysM repeat protein
MNVYTVKRGDTLGRIARKFYGDAARYPLIVSANRVSDPDRLAVGRRLVIPDAAVAGSAFASDADPLPEAPSTSISSRRLNALHPVVRARANAFLLLCAQRGLGVMVSQGLRSWEDQMPCTPRVGRCLPSGGSIG